MEVEFDVKIDSGVLYDYMLHHTYTSFDRWWEPRWAH